MNGAREPHFFGIRHLSPAGSYHLLALLDEVRPTAVLIEGPSDAGALASQLVARGVVPPVALLAYTVQLPVRTLLYPFAEYSPEYQALRWAERNGSQAEFIDLPTGVSLALNALRHERSAEGDPLQATDEGGGIESSSTAHTADGMPNEPEAGAAQKDFYARVAERSGEPDFESYWERNFEHRLRHGAYRQSISRFSEEMRAWTAGEERRRAPHEAAYNEIREAYMRRKISDTLVGGHDPGRVVVLTGAYHTSALAASLPAMTDDELALLPRVPTKMTLMPYSYYKLSSHSGYGAGNAAPAYFELMWRCMRQRELDRLQALYLSSVAARLREGGTYRSTASVIEGVRLAGALSSMHDGELPAWKDLRDAATILFGHGELSVVAEALARTDIGTAIGSLPEGVSQTPIQDDLNRELSRLKLGKYKTLVATDLELDLRENRSVKSAESAFLDLHRSVLFHRLALLGIRFARKQHRRQADATWAEHWVLQWSPEAEIEIVEATIKGETVEMAAAYAIHEQLLACEDIADAARLIRQAGECGLPQVAGQAVAALQRLAVDAGSFAQIAQTQRELSVLIQYGSVRRIDTEPLLPILRQLFLRGCLMLLDASGCNDDAATEMMAAVGAVNAVAQEHYAEVDEPLWLEKLKALAVRDDRNPRLSGYAFSILLERNEAGEETFSSEVARRLSPGMEVDLGAGWFEGLSMRNRYALLSRDYLWRHLDDYIGGLEPEPFKRSLVYLRRAFGAFEPREKAAIAELLGEIWGTGAEQSGEALQRPLDEEEKERLDEINEFDFGDL